MIGFLSRTHVLYVQIVTLNKNLILRIGLMMVFYLLPILKIRIVEKLILHLFLFYENGQLKQFC
ncbi:hypothetical protein C5473_06480 [Leptospira interrogans serovar Weerasinghe]|nr:hypothetical protein C5473_06480 [Leptospira interrogans serovar Weerasinghe]